jgi:hypothetical protein
VSSASDPVHVADAQSADPVWDRFCAVVLFSHCCAGGIAYLMGSMLPIGVSLAACALAALGLVSRTPYLLLLIPGGLLLIYPEFHVLSAMFTTAGALQGVARRKMTSNGRPQ